MKVLSRNAVEATQMTLGLVPEVLDSIDVISGFNKALGMIDTVMSELRNIQSVIAQKAIRVDNAIRFDCLPNDRNQGILLGIRNDDDMHLSAFRRPKTGTLPAAPRPRFPFREPPK